MKVRDDGRVVSQAVVLSIGVNADGQREVLGLDGGPTEAGAFWLQFLRSLVACGVGGVRLVSSDAHQGLEGAIVATLQGANWQRCRVYFVRNVLAVVRSRPPRWWPRRSGRPSRSRTRAGRTRPGGGWPTACAAASRM